MPKHKPQRLFLPTLRQHRAKAWATATSLLGICASLFILGLQALDRAAAILDALEHNLRGSRGLSRAKVFGILCNPE
jgi:uncharacterized membrane protein